METVLTIKNITKKYGAFVAVNNLSFTINKGNVYGILGPNGSGKSTTLGIILNVVNKTNGEVLWYKGNTTTQQALKKVGAIIEHPNFYPYMTGRQNLKLVCKIKGVSTTTIKEKLSLVNLLDSENKKFSTYSLGMKQRLAIASALLNNPEILILDEPTNGLDPQGIHDIREIIKQIAAQGTTILLASHLLDEVEKTCTHVIVLSKGGKLYSGRVDEMISNHGFFELKSHQETALIALLKNHYAFGQVVVRDGLIKAFLKTALKSDEFNKELFEKGIILTHLVQRKESLEEQFLQLTDQHT